LGSQAVDRVLGGVLQPRVERRLDGQALVERASCALLPAAELVDDLLLDPRGEVRIARVLDRRADVAAGRQRGEQRPLLLRRRDEVLLDHPLQHQRTAPARRLAVLERVVRARRSDHPGDQRRLTGLEQLRALRRVLGAAAGMVEAEVGAGGGLDAVCAVAEVDRVEVVAQDALL
jgi:hypothetical protein